MSTKELRGFLLVMAAATLCTIAIIASVGVVVWSLWLR